jgi:hypothetical protein
LRLDSSAASSVIEAPIIYSAQDSIITSLNAQKVFLYNNSKITYQDIELTAYYIELDMQTREVYAEGIMDSTGTLTQKPLFKDRNEEYESQTLRYNFKTQKGIITDVVTKQGEGFIHSERTKKILPDVFLLTNGKYTVCDADHPHFYLHLTKAKVISNDKIITGPAYMVLEDFPIYFPILPFGYFPSSTTYSSGIMIPSYGEEINRGFYLRDGGYYWAANEYFDIAVRGDIYSNGSWEGKFNTNYRKRYKYNGGLNFNYALNKSGEDWMGTLSKQKQFSVSWTHSQDAKANPGQVFSARVNLSTSGYDKQNAVTTQDYLSTTKSSNISFTKQFQNTPFNASINLGHTQNSRDTTIGLTLPEFTINMSKIYPFRNKNRVGPAKWYHDFGITYTGNIRNTITAKEHEVLKKSLTKDWGNGMKHSIPITLPGFNILNYFTFSPAISYNEKWYFKKNSYEYRPDEVAKDGSHVFVKTENKFNRVYDYSFSLGTSTSIYGNYMPLNPKSKISMIRHKITPQVSFSYRPDFGASRYGYWQAVQTDSIGTIRYFDVNNGGAYGGSPSRGASGSINFSLSNNVEMKVLDVLKETSTDQAQTSGESSETAAGTDNKTNAQQYKKVSIIDDLRFGGSYNLIADSLNLSTINIQARTTIQGVTVSATGTLDPYMINEQGVRINKFAWNARKGLGKLGRLTNANLSFGMQFQSKKGQNEASANQELVEGEEKVLPGTYSDYVDFNIPWDVNFQYSLVYTGATRPNEKGRTTQTLNINGNLNLTEKWRVTMTTNFDIMAGEFSHTNFNITRDLHCWQMNFNVTPFGYRKSYMFTINARSMILKDLKLTKNRSYMDN